MADGTTTLNIWLEYLISRDRGVSIILEQRQRPGDGMGRVDVYRRPASHIVLVTFDDGAVHPVTQTRYVIKYFMLENANVTL